VERLPPDWGLLSFLDVNRRNVHNEWRGPLGKAGEAAQRVAWRLMLRKLWEDPIANLVIWLTLAAIGVAVAFYLLGKIRRQTAQQELSANELISEFRNLHSRGVLSDAEFRTIKTRLADRLQDEIKDTGETG
jgi:hypothetical protein